MREKKKYIVEKGVERVRKVWIERSLNSFCTLKMYNVQRWSKAVGDNGKVWKWRGEIESE